MNYILNMHDLGQRLEGIIKTRGVSQASVARETGLTPAIVNGLCRGTRKSVRAETLGRLGVALRVSTDYLLGITDDPQPSAAMKSSKAPQETKPKRPRPRKAAPMD